MRSETMYRLLVGTVLLLLMVIGIYLGVGISGDIKEEAVIISNTDNVKVYNENKVENENKEKLTKVSVRLTDSFPECGHSVETEENYNKTTRENVIKDIRSKDTGYKLIGEQDGVLLFEKVHTGKCTNHYKVLFEDDMVVIYRMGNKNEFEPYQVTAITKGMVREDISLQLEKGIVVDGIEELFILMEDIES